MKKILLLFAIYIMCSCGFASTDAEKKAFYERRKSNETNEIYSRIHEVEIKGPLYLVYKDFYNGYMIHAEHCPCKASKNLINN